MGRDLHSEPFDEETQKKLWLFRSYLQSWLPVFLSPENPSVRQVNVFDFFAGPGRDSVGNPGSPLIALDSIEEYAKFLDEKEIKINLFLNEADNNKFQELESSILRRKKAHDSISVKVACCDFQEVFDKEFDSMEGPETANFLFLDQYGIKYVNAEVFNKILELKKTDFMFFFSSATVRRFCGLPEVKKHVDIPKQIFEDSDYRHSHRVVVEYYRSLVPTDVQVFIHGFSFLKRSNVYGLVFGSKHPLGIDKFLHATWKVDTDRGEATFDIDQEGIDPVQRSLFAELDIPQKLTLFESGLLKRIKSHELKSNHDLYEYALEQGFLPRHAKKYIAELIRQGIVEGPAIPVSYKAWKKAPQPIRLKDDAHG